MDLSRIKYSTCSLFIIITLISHLYNNDCINYAKRILEERDVLASSNLAGISLKDYRMQNTRQDTRTCLDYLLSPLSLFFVFVSSASFVSFASLLALHFASLLALHFASCSLHLPASATFIILFLFCETYNVLANISMLLDDCPRSSASISAHYYYIILQVSCLFLFC